VIAIVGVGVQQLYQAKSERQLREFELRRDHLLRLADIATVPSRIYSDIERLDVPISQIGTRMQEVSGAISQCTCIVSLPTLKASFAATKAFVVGFYAMLRLRARLEFIEGKLEMINKALEEIRATTRSTYQTGADANSPLLQTLERDRREHLKLQSDFIAMKRAGQLEIRERSRRRTGDYSPLLATLQIAIRSELDQASHRHIGLSVDEDQFAMMVRDSWEHTSKEAYEFALWLQTYFEEVESGKHPLQALPDGLGKS
jgi:hypothetical protein